MDNSNTNSESSTPKAMKDENKEPAPIAKRNIMREHFQAWHAAGRPSLFPAGHDVYIPKPFFFYGTLADSSKLQEVLQLPSLPVLKPARVRTYKIMLWGQYPALVDDGSLDSYVDGATCVIKTEQHLQMLEEYETKAYRVGGIRIEVDGGMVSGRTFLWAKSDTSELTEGTWSLEEWKRDVEASYFRPVDDFK
jgi:gamma-glutamylcyclotransferase (GGCT)/AIG2-like uncharacterized protein YtfP